MTETAPPPHPPITAVKPQRVARGTAPRQQPRTYVGAGTAQHTLRPADPPTE